MDSVVAGGQLHVRGAADPDRVVAVYCVIFAVDVEDTAADRQEFLRLQTFAWTFRQ